MKKIFTSALFTFLFLGPALLVNSCKVIDPAEDIPCYIHIDKIDLVNVPTNLLTAKQDITDAWVYVDNELIGAFEMPCNVPVLVGDGTHEVKVLAGVKQNGISSTRAIYPFFRAYTVTTTLTRGQSVSLAPQVEYFTTTNVDWTENFEGSGTTWMDIPGSPFMNVFKKDITPGDAFEGNGCGYIRLTDDTTQCRIKSSQSYALPTDGNPVYLELHYRSNNSFVVGLETNTSEFRPWITVNPSSTWNKIYIDLTSTAYQQPIASSFQLYFATAKETSAGTDAEIYLDNIKLLHK